MPEPEKKNADDEAVDQVVGFLTSVRGMIVVGVLAVGLLVGVVWSMF